LIEFDQREFVADRQPLEQGLADSGYAWIPASCAARTAQPCRVHIALHGCLQNHATVGDKFMRHAGYNRWADNNRMIVLYPQTMGTPPNPNACWNWFDNEHNDPDYATRLGYQIKALRDMLDRLAGVAPAPRPAQCFTATNVAHIQAGRAHVGWLFVALANGSDDVLGADSSWFVATLKQVAPKFYVRGSCP
jgi:poly(3-hydroxybutyrate) depolymerase